MTMLEHLQARVDKLTNFLAEAEKNGRLARMYAAKSCLVEARKDFINYAGLLQPITKEN